MQIYFSGFRVPSLFWHCSAIGKHFIKKEAGNHACLYPKLTYEKTELLIKIELYSCKYKCLAIIKIISDSYIDVLKS